jgi:hypothetical protein
MASQRIDHRSVGTPLTSYKNTKVSLCFLIGDILGYLYWLLAIGYLKTLRSISPAPNTSDRVHLSH